MGGLGVDQRGGRGYVFSFVGVCVLVWGRTVLRFRDRECFGAGQKVFRRATECILLCFGVCFLGCLGKWTLEENV